ncbi:hypothetical protein [Pelistega sp. MC2]|uniref:phage protein n=1 Tax=Pelistega sp. MC2 TaxID=1720297 RepID=UPI0008DAAFF2|nr:hypothetical protein [Pelistega sp. MC2]
MKQYGRRWQVEIIGDDNTLIVDKLRVGFEVDKTINEKPNPAFIRIWNLNRDHLNQLLNKEYTRIVLSTGYQELRPIYSGDITKVKVMREGVDFVLEIESADGFKDYTTARSSVTLKAGATDEEIIAEVQKTMPNVKRGALDFPNKRKLPRGRVLNGDSRAILRKIAVNNKADWSIQDGELIFLPRDKVLDTEAVLLSQDTGLIGSLEQTDDGLELTCLLNPLLQIGGMVRLESILEFFNGEYKIVKLAHTGNSMDSEWHSKMTVVGGKFQKVEDKGSKKK